MNTLIQCSAESIFYFPFYDTQSRYFNKLQTALTTRAAAIYEEKILIFSLFICIVKLYVFVLLSFINYYKDKMFSSEIFF